MEDGLAVLLNHEWTFFEKDTADAGAPVDPAAESTEKVLDLGLLSIAIPKSFVQGEHNTVKYNGGDFKDPTQFNGWEGTLDSTVYTTDDLELIVFIRSLSEDTANRYIVPLVTEEYDSKAGRLSIMEAQTGASFDQIVQNIYPYNALDPSVGGGHVLTRQGIPHVDNFYNGDEVQENYGSMIDGREIVSRYGMLGTKAVLISAVSSNDEAYTLAQNILNTITPAPDVTMSGVR